MNSSFKFPELTEGKELDTLEYSNNKEEIDIIKLEQEGMKLFESFKSQDKTLDKYLPKSEEAPNENTEHMKKESIFTLSNNEYVGSKRDQTVENSTSMHSRKSKYSYFFSLIPI